MIAGNTATLSTVQTQDAEFVPTGAALTITWQPHIIPSDDDVEVASAINVDVSPGTSSKTQTFTAQFTPAYAGVHRLEWDWSQGGTDYVAIGQEFAFWSDVSGRVQEILQSAYTVPDGVVERAFVDMFAILLAQYPCLVGYGVLPIGDRGFVDTGLAYMIADQISNVRFGGEAGLPVLLKIDEFEARFAPGTADDPAKWRDLAAQNLNCVSCIRAGLAKAAKEFSLTYSNPRPRCSVPAVSIVDGLLIGIESIERVAWWQGYGLSG